jgi:hypothetical protein
VYQNYFTAFIGISLITKTSICPSSDGFGGRCKFVNMRLLDCGKIASAVSVEIGNRLFDYYNSDY